MPTWSRPVTRRARSHRVRARSRPARVCGRRIGFLCTRSHRARGAARVAARCGDESASRNPLEHLGLRSERVTLRSSDPHTAARAAQRPRCAVDKGTKGRTTLPGRPRARTMARTRRNVRRKRRISCRSMTAPSENNARGRRGAASCARF